MNQVNYSITAFIKYIYFDLPIHYSVENETELIIYESVIFYIFSNYIALTVQHTHYESVLFDF